MGKSLEMEEQNNDEIFKRYEEFLSCHLESNNSLTYSLHLSLGHSLDQNMKVSNISIKKLEEELTGFPCKSIDKINCIYRDPCEGTREYTFYEGVSPTHITQASVSTGANS